MLDLAVRDIHPQDTPVVYPLIQQDPLYRVGIAPFQEDDRVVHPHEPQVESKQVTAAQLPGWSGWSGRAAGTNVSALHSLSSCCCEHLETPAPCFPFVDAS